MLNMGFREDIEYDFGIYPGRGKTDGSVFCDHAKADLRYHQEIPARCRDDQSGKKRADRSEY